MASDYDYDEVYYDICNDGVDNVFDDCNLSADDFQSLTAPATMMATHIYTQR